MATVVEVINLDKKAKKAIANKIYYENNKEKMFELFNKWKKEHKDDPKLKERNRKSSEKHYSNPENRERKKERMRARYHERKLEQAIAV